MLNGKMPKVEKGVPLPPMSMDAYVRSLKPGYSFVVPRAKASSWQSQMYRSLGAGKWRMQRLKGKRTRFWRVA